MKKLINKLTNLKDLLHHQDIADILLVIDGFKPATLIEITHKKHHKRPEKQFDKLKEILEEFGLVYNLKINYHDTSKLPGEYSIIVKNKQTLKKLTTAILEKNTKIRRLKTGLLVGYPKSAVIAFANNNYITNEQIPKHFLKRHYFKFLNFRLSKNWKKEIKYLKKKASIIKKMSPKLYKKMASLKT